MLCKQAIITNIKLLKKILIKRTIMVSRTSPTITQRICKLNIKKKKHDIDDAGFPLYQTLSKMNMEKLFKY